MNEAHVPSELNSHPSTKYKEVISSHNMFELNGRKTSMVLDVRWIFDQPRQMIHCCVHVDMVELLIMFCPYVCQEHKMQNNLSFGSGLLLLLAVLLRIASAEFAFVIFSFTDMLMAFAAAFRGRNFLFLGKFFTSLLMW